MIWRRFHVSATEITPWGRTFKNTCLGQTFDREQTTRGGNALKLEPRALGRLDGPEDDLPVEERPDEFTGLLRLVVERLPHVGDGGLSATEDPIEVVLDELRGGLGGSELPVDLPEPLLAVGNALQEAVGAVVRSCEGIHEPVSFSTELFGFLLQERGLGLGVLGLGLPLVSKLADQLECEFLGDVRLDPFDDAVVRGAHGTA
jgi:hypothetical protein